MASEPTPSFGPEQEERILDDANDHSPVSISAGLDGGSLPEEDAGHEDRQQEHAQQESLGDQIQRRRMGGPERGG